MTDEEIQQVIRDFVVSGASYIPKESLVVGRKYICRARNFSVGLWNGEVFEYQRTKFGSTFPDREFHWDNGAPFGTVKPIMEYTSD